MAGPAIRDHIRFLLNGEEVRLADVAPDETLLDWLRLPPTEMEALSGIPLRGYEVGLFVGLPMLACLGVILVSRRHFLARGRTAPAAARGW